MRRPTSLLLTTHLLTPHLLTTYSPPPYSPPPHLLYKQKKTSLLGKPFFLLPKNFLPMKM